MQMDAQVRKAGGRLSREDQRRLGDILQRVYDDVIHQGVPDRFKELLSELDGQSEREGGAARQSAALGSAALGSAALGSAAHGPAALGPAALGQAKTGHAPEPDRLVEAKGLDHPRHKGSS